VDPPLGPHEGEARVSGPLGTATVRGVAWPEHLVIHALVVHDGALPGAAEAARGALLAAWGGGPRVTHAGLDSLDLLVGWRDDPRAPFAVASGTVGSRLLVYDGLDRLPAEADGPVAASVLVDPEFGPLLGAVEPIALRDALATGSWLARVVALRRLANVAWADPAEVEPLLAFALTDDAASVRQFAAVLLSRLYPGQRFAPSLSGLLGALDDPLAALRRHGPRPELTASGASYDPGRARRAVRAALLWVAGNLAWAADGYHAPDLVDPRTVGAGLRARLVDEARRWSAAREDRARALAGAEVAGGDGLAVDAALGLLDVARVAVLRGRLVPEGDTLAWWSTAVGSLVPEDGGRVARIVHAPS
jgi:hypothetical protein